MFSMWVSGRSRLVKDEGATMVAYAASEQRISKLEGELKRPVDVEAETAQPFDSERKRRADVDQQLYQAREDAVRLMLVAVG